MTEVSKMKSYDVLQAEEALRRSQEAIADLAPGRGEKSA